MNIAAKMQVLSGMLRVGEAAKYLGVSAETLRNWDKSGKLVATRHPVTGYRFYDIKELERFLDKVIAERQVL